MEVANRVLSALKVGDKMEKGLCFSCGELFTLGDQLLHKNIQIFVMDIH